MPLVSRRKLTIRLELLLLLLLLLLPLRSAAARPGRGCLDAQQLKNRTERFVRKHANLWGDAAAAADPQRGARTCEQAAREMRGPVHARSLSPWSYSVDSDPDRFPHKIAFAKCLCKGCIVNQSESTTYNSEPVSVLQRVLRKTPCEGQPGRFEVKRYFIEVPVACTCIVPKYA